LICHLTEVLKYQFTNIELLKVSSINAGFILTLATMSCLPVFGQSSDSNVTSSLMPITVMTDKSSYSDGDKIIISGMVKDQLNVPISIVIRDSNQNIVWLGQATVDSDNKYSTEATAGGSLWTAAGTYEIDTTYGSKDRTAKTLFEFTGYHLYPVQIQGSSYNATYTITNGTIISITPNIDAKLLVISIDASGNGSLTISFPRTLIDARTDANDSQFVVQEDGMAITFLESKSDTARTLTMSFSSHTKQIEVIGTQIVPEFGPLTFTVLTASLGIFLYVKRHAWLHREFIR